MFNLPQQQYKRYIFCVITLWNMRVNLGTVKQKATMKYDLMNIGQDVSLQLAGEHMQLS